MLIHVTRYAQIEMHLGEKENTAVQIAADKLLQDFRRVLDVHTYEGLDPQLVVEIHTMYWTRCHFIDTLEHCVQRSAGTLVVRGAVFLDKTSLVSIKLNKRGC